MLFGILLALFFAWMGVLLVMYFTTVYPHPENDPHRRPATPAAPAPTGPQ